MGKAGSLTNGEWPKLFILIASILATLTILLPLLSGEKGMISLYFANIIGQIATFALLALALDLIWGFAGILSLGHGLFFALGGYLIAMHMLKAGYVYGGITPDLMTFMGWSDLPSHWYLFEYFSYTLFLIILVPGLIAFCYGFVSFRSRVKGVYFAIITQALTYVAMLLMYRNDTGFGGNNGMTGFSTLLSQSISAPDTVVILATTSLFLLLIAFIACGFLMRSPFGRMLIAVRDDEARLRFLGYDTLWLKLSIWCLSGVLSAIAGALYVPQVGIINPRLLSPEVSIEIAVWVALGGRGGLSGAIIGAVVISGLKFWLTGFLPEAWPFILAILVLIVVTALPNGLLDVRLPNYKELLYPRKNDYD